MMSETNQVVIPSGWCKGKLGPLGDLVPNKIALIDRSNILTFEARTGNPPVSGQVLTFELPGNIQSGSHEDWARLFGIYSYGGEHVEAWRGISGTIDLVINRTQQQFSATLDYKVLAPDGTEFYVNVDLGISGFNQLITPS
jgi:hypothetical protein